MDESLFAGLCARLGIEPDHRGEAHTECPSCLHPVVRGTTHFSFSERGGHCFVCGYSCSLRTLADQIGDVKPSSKRWTPRPEQPHRWREIPNLTLDRILDVPQKYDAWRKYKPLTDETIDRWRLGAGILPSSPCPHGRLIYPVFEEGHLIALRGRSAGCDCPKWLSAAGSKAALWGLSLIQPGSYVILCENPVDAMLLMQEFPKLVGIAPTAGAGAWHPEWTAAIQDRRPEHVTVWYDNDLAGQATGRMYGLLAKEHEAKLRAAGHTRIPEIPKPNGFKVAEELSAARVPVTMYRWLASARPHDDLGTMLTEAGGWEQ